MVLYDEQVAEHLTICVYDANALSSVALIDKTNKLENSIDLSDEINEVKAKSNTAVSRKTNKTKG